MNQETEEITNMVRDAVVSALAELGIPQEDVIDTALLKDDLELDSTEVVQIELEIKRRFAVDVKLEYDQLTVGDVCRQVEALLGNATGAPA